jgi:AcrR family transcriptional regulator
VVLRGRIDRRRGRPAKPGVTALPNLLAGEDLPAEPHQKRSLRKRARLKSAGLALFGEKGYEGASIAAIARRAGLAVGTFYQHFRSKRQLLLALMDDLLEYLSRLDLRSQTAADPRAGLRAMLARAFSGDLRYLGAYRAWQEAALSDAELQRKQEHIRAWTTMRVTAVLQFLLQMPGTRAGVDVPSLARVLDTFFWSLLAQAGQMDGAELDRWIDASTHLIFHAMFTDPLPRPGDTGGR